MLSVEDKWDIYGAKKYNYLGGNNRNLEAAKHRILETVGGNILDTIPENLKIRKKFLNTKLKDIELIATEEHNSGSL